MLEAILFTHDDLDGAGCRIIFELAYEYLGDNMRVINCGNKTIDQDVQLALDKELIGSKTIITFADILPTRPMLKYLSNQFANIYIWDHHPTNEYAIELVYGGYVEVVHEIPGEKKPSGTSLMYDFFKRTASHRLLKDDLRVYYFKDHNRLFDDLVETIRSYDTYEWKTTNNLEARKLHTLFDILGMDRFTELYRMRIRANDICNLLTESDRYFVDAILEQEQKNINSIINSTNLSKHVYSVQIKGYRAAVMFIKNGININEVAHQLLSKYPSFNIFIGFNMGTGEYSYRCIDKDINLANLIAKPAGGGGHPQACGSSIPEDLLRMIVDSLLTHIDSDYL